MGKRIFLYIMEIWKDIIGYEGLYQISNLGNVKSLDRLIKNGVNSFMIKKGQIIKPNTEGGGYFFVTLNKENKRVHVKNHQLVAIAFLGHRRCGLKKVINHKNFNKKDNALENLEIVSNRQNANHKHIKSSSIYTGVCWHKTQKTWYASIYINGKNIYLGSFKNEIDASMAYENKVKELNE